MAQDWFAEALRIIGDTYYAKGKDYESDDAAPFASFAQVGDLFGIPEEIVADIFEANKLVRLRSLRENGREPSYESVADSYKDKAVFAVMALAMYLQQQSNAKTENTGRSGTGQHISVAQPQAHWATPGVSA